MALKDWTKVFDNRYETQWDNSKNTHVINLIKLPKGGYQINFFGSGQFPISTKNRRTKALAMSNIKSYMRSH